MQGHCEQTGPEEDRRGAVDEGEEPVGHFPSRVRGILRGVAPASVQQPPFRQLDEEPFHREDAERPVLEFLGPRISSSFILSILSKSLAIGFLFTPPCPSTEEPSPSGPR